MVYEEKEFKSLEVEPSSWKDISRSRESAAHPALPSIGTSLIGLVTGEPSRGKQLASSAAKLLCGEEGSQETLGCGKKG